jgi:hypothetical protein
MPDKDIAEVDASTKTLTTTLAKDLAKVDGSIKTPGGKITKDGPRPTPGSSPRAPPGARTGATPES